MIEGEKKKPKWIWPFLTVGLAILLAAFAGLMIWNSADASERSFEHRAEQNAQAYENTARIHAERACSHLEKPKVRPCVHEQYHAARERERQEYNLQAQLVSSVWTRAMGLAAIVGMVVGIIGVGLVYITFEETRRNADEAKRSVDAFMDAERARLTVIKPHMGEKDGKNPQILVPVNVVNFGRSACKVKAIEWAGLDTTEWHQNWKATEHASRDVNIVVPADGGHHFVWSVNAPLNKPYIAGHVIYDTQFSRDRHSYFLWKLGELKDGGGWNNDYAELEEQGGKGWPQDS